MKKLALCMMVTALFSGYSLGANAAALNATPTLSTSALSAATVTAIAPTLDPEPPKVEPTKCTSLEQFSVELKKCIPKEAGKVYIIRLDIMCKAVPGKPNQATANGTLTVTDDKGVVLAVLAIDFTAPIGMQGQPKNLPDPLLTKLQEIINETKKNGGGVCKGVDGPGIKGGAGATWTIVIDKDGKASGPTKK